MPDNLVTVKQITFGGGLDAVSAPHLIGSDAIQAGSNVDFSLEWGALPVRRGCAVAGIGGILGTRTNPVGGPLALVVRNYALNTGVSTNAAFYAADTNGNTFDDLDFAGQYASVGYSGGTAPNLIPQASFYNGYIYIANGSAAFRHNGTGTPQDWILPQPATPSVSVLSQWLVSSPFVGFAGTGVTNTYTATEGTISGTSTQTPYGTGAPIILTTCTTGVGTRVVLLGTCSTTNWENPIKFLTTPTGTAVTSATGTYTLGGQADMHMGWPNGDTTGVSGPWVGTATVTQTMTNGQYATDYIYMSLPSQQTVVTIQIDLSIGDASFTNYWHQETTPQAINDATTDPVSQLLAAQGGQTIDSQTIALNLSRGNLQHIGQQSNVAISPVRRTVSKTTISATPSPWAINRSDYKFIGVTGAPDFTNIQAVRVIIEFNTPGQLAAVGGIVTYGGLGYCLSDENAGISYYQTFARVENGEIIAESAPSLPSSPLKGQYAHAEITVAPNGNTTAGITHRVIYRTGGLLQDAYRVGSVAITSSAVGNVTIYDYAFPDMGIISNPPLTRFLWSTWPAPSAGTGLLGVNAVSLPWQSRMWIGVGNQLYWTAPGIPSKVQDDTQTTVADIGDPIAAILPAQNLVIVNQQSVFEMAGSIFEGTGQNWSLTRTLSRRGSAAPKTCITTPYGIVLFGYDGMSFYRQGYGIDSEIPWIYEKIGDLWKGTGTNDPAPRKGRIPALNPTAIFNSCAAYKDERVYLAVPTGTNTTCDTLFVFNFAHQAVWMYQYPFNIMSLFWDRVGNALLAGGADGFIYQLEVGSQDQAMLGGHKITSGVPWSVVTREWTTPDDSLLENLQVEAIGTGTWLADVDNTNTYTLGTFTNATKGWQPASLQGTLGNNLNFILQGTQSLSAQTIYEIQWDAIPQAQRVTFFETDPIATPSENYIKTWLADLTVTSGTTTGSILVDGTVIMTASFVAPSAPLSGVSNVTERKIYETGLANITAGKNISAIYNGGTFRHYATNWEFEPKPFYKNTWLVTYKKAGGVTQADMARFFAMDIEGQATNTITTTWIVDGTSFTTNTLIFGATDAGEEAGIVRNYMDQIPFPPGGRGYLFQQQITASTPFRVWRASLDIDRIGIKGLSRVTLNGSPVQGS